MPPHLGSLARRATALLLMGLAVVALLPRWRTRRSRPRCGSSEATPSTARCSYDARPAARDGLARPLPPADHAGRRLGGGAARLLRRRAPRDRRRHRLQRLAAHGGRRRRSWPRRATPRRDGSSSRRRRSSPRPPPAPAPWRRGRCRWPSGSSRISSRETTPTNDAVLNARAAALRSLASGRAIGGPITITHADAKGCAGRSAVPLRLTGRPGSTATLAVTGGSRRRGARDGPLRRRPAAPTRRSRRPPPGAVTVTASTDGRHASPAPRAPARAPAPRRRPSSWCPRATRPPRP